MAEIARFKTLPNTEAEFLRDDMGFNFKKIPPKVKKNIQNTWEVLKQQEPNWLRRIGQLVLTLVFLEGAYFRKSGIVLTSGKRETTYHEDIHAYIGQELGDSPNAEEILIDRLNPQNRALDEAVKRDLTIEKIVCQIIADEGLATTISKEAEARIRLKEKGTPITTNNTVIFHEPTPATTYRRVGAWKKAEESVEKFTNCLKYPKSPFRYFYNLKRGTSKLIRSQYIAGEYFCISAISRLMERGQNLIEATKTIIHNMPSKIDEIKNPESYVNRILGTNQTIAATA